MGNSNSVIRDCMAVLTFCQDAVGSVVREDARRLVWMKPEHVAFGLELGMAC